ncbi:unnamed protein product [Didymodactylos carnosus]|uniref:Laccase n=1 Tax=Didymodactylos carnosus TaxID=1234261 RepID=A0A815QJ30_9BILA|nr:unnamed protein product [Didymodactylos carnosus]CAF1464025.1 unnamed protein product [Didymodactylos carnosus]CAF3817046.1 unnamed protein product [Didymodactylos carnosus]CAF4333570.1 unnamed protein product [Didymodactylos carnosus]
MIRSLLFSIILFSLCIADYCDKTTFTAEFRVQQLNRSPDGFKRSLLSINNQFPAPIINICKGDTINITVVNTLDMSTSIHWHGMFQIGTLTSDGVPGVTQCAIPSNQKYHYKFHTGIQTGTYWYHSHSSIQYIDGLKSALIIHDPEDPWKNYYDGEEVLMLSDWYHKQALTLQKSYLSQSSGGDEPVPDTGLINGIGQYNCAVNKCQYYNASIKIGAAKRFRIINTSAFAVFLFTIEEHTMKVIEADGISLNGEANVSGIRINAGQRYSVLVEGKPSTNRNYWIRAIIDPNPMAFPSLKPNVSAILSYNDKYGLPSELQLNKNDGFILDSFREGDSFIDPYSLQPMEPDIPSKSNKTVKVEIEFDDDENGVNLAYFNNNSFVPLMNTTLLSIVQTNRSYPKSNNVISIDYADIVDIIINNHDDGEHPIHLHGHTFSIIANGKTNDGDFNKKKVIFNTKNPLRRDTVSINPNSYMVLRFVANNPGIWMMHCHIDWHLQAGLAIIFAEAAQHVQKLYGTTKNLNKCATYN